MLITDTLVLTVPASWEGKYNYTIGKDGSITFYEKLNYSADPTYGKLFTVQTGNEEKYKQFEAIVPVKRLKQKGDMICFLSYPVSQEWLPELETSYDVLYCDQNGIQSILDSIIMR